LILPPADTVNLQVVDDHNNTAVYILQRAPNYFEHALTNGPSNFGYREIFLEEAGGTFTRNLYDDLASIAGLAGVGEYIVQVGFGLATHGWAVLDDLRIGAPSAVWDTTRPTLAITAPTIGQRLTNALMTVQGRASDNAQVADVFYQLNADGWNLASSTNGWTNWMATVTLKPGTNVIQAYAVDVAGSASSTNTVTIVLLSPLTVTTNGCGSVNAGFAGTTWREVGKRYTNVATACSGYVFDGWSRSMDSNASRLVFTMQPDMVLQANFIPNPFRPVQGSYYGLIQAEAAAHESSGYIVDKDRGVRRTVRLSRHESDERLQRCHSAETESWCWIVSGHR
jgi:hypothetical protein